MNVEINNLALDACSADLTITLLDKASFNKHSAFETLTRSGFKAEQDKIVVLHESAQLFCGIETFDTDAVRSALAATARALGSCNYTSAKIACPNAELLQPLTEGMILGSYIFDKYKSKPETQLFEKLSICASGLKGNSFEAAKKTVHDALVIAEATNFTRDLVNATPQDITPNTLSIIASDLADANNLKCTVLDHNGLESEGMNAMIAVGRASVHKPHLIHLSYQPKNPTHVISLVGKGLTYDSGGLSIKPATAMVTMKMDKAGACAVMGVLKAVSELKLPVEVHGFIGAAENMINANAYKPDDVLVAKNGKTIEVRNTDAEGRLVLADVLCYAQEKVEADYLLDFATLTGACMVALGEYTIGMMGHNESLKNSFFDVSDRSGELLGTLPFNRHLKKLLKSEIADISNIGSKPYGGAITAALFLDTFIEEKMKEKWMHFDIAGAAYTESAWGCNPHGGTGAGVRLTLEWLKQLKK